MVGLFLYNDYVAGADRRFRQDQRSGVKAYRNRETGLQETLGKKSPCLPFFMLTLGKHAVITGFLISHFGFS